MTAQPSFRFPITPAVLADIDRAFEQCAEQGEFHAELVFRACSPSTRDILTIPGNRNVLGAVFRAKRATRRFRLTGRVIPSTHAGSRGRLIPLWTKVTP